MNTKANREEQRVLEILDAVGKKRDLSQRHLAQHMGVALGLANSYLKRCIRKGFIKISEAPANRYIYYLTPKGFTEKSRLTAKYLSTSFAFYRQAGESCIHLYRECENRGWRRVILGGVSDLAEIAFLRAREMNIKIVGCYDPHSERRRFVDRPVWGEFGKVDAFDACVLTDLSAPRLQYEHLSKFIPNDRILVPDILRLK